MPRAPKLEWFEELPCAVTVCDRRYRILYMNDRSAEVNKESGGKALIGKSLLDCHPAAAKKKLKEVMASDRPHLYTVERKGKKKLVFQGQWRKGGRLGGLVELYMELPKDMENHVRD
jgi:transcriptional regulator with PAS, ATPase and Fis domain